ncbi:Pentatricopeptide repeat-containing protein [Glycine soja]
MLGTGRTLPDKFTYPVVIKACGDLSLIDVGVGIHGQTFKFGYDSDTFVQNTLLAMYMNAGEKEAAQLVFDLMQERTVISWNTMINGDVHALVQEKGFWGDIVVWNALPDMYVKCGQMKEAWLLAKGVDEKDVCEGVKPNSVSIASLLSACGSLVYLNYGKCLHAWAIRQKLESEVIVETALIDMYAKRNQGNLSYKVFMGTSKKRTAPWNALLSGFIQNKLAREAIELFKQMHAGLVDEGFSLFNFMLKQHQVIPHVDHYTCIVDLLGRTGRLNDAYNPIRTMPITPNHAVWGALLGACVIHENVELGEAAVGRWGDAEKIRDMVNEVGLRKLPAHSLVEQDGNDCILTMRERNRAELGWYYLFL